MARPFGLAMIVIIARLLCFEISFTILKKGRRIGLIGILVSIIISGIPRITSFNLAMMTAFFIIPIFWYMGFYTDGWISKIVILCILSIILYKIYDAHTFVNSDYTKEEQGEIFVLVDENNKTYKQAGKNFDIKSAISVGEKREFFRYKNPETGKITVESLDSHKEVFLVNTEGNREPYVEKLQVKCVEDNLGFICYTLKRKDAYVIHCHLQELTSR